MFCSKCGAKLPDKARFCNKCGCCIIAVPENVTSSIPTEEQHADGNVEQHSGMHNENEVAVATPPQQKTHNSTSSGPNANALSRELTDKERAARRALARKKKQRRKRIITAVICLILAGAIGLGLWFFVFKKDAATVPDEELVSDSPTFPEETLIGAFPYPHVKYAGEYGDFSYFVLGNDTVRIKSYNGNASEVIIPNEIDGFPVSEIAEFAFFPLELITSVTIPNSVTYIGEGAFNSCLALSSIVIPDSITYIEEGAFENTPWLDNQTDEFVIVGDGVLLDYNGNNTDVVIPHGVKMISNSFMNNDFITSVSIPDTVSHIGSGAFYYCLSLSSITIPDRVSFIGADAFYKCNALSSISIPDSVAYIGNTAFAYCESLSSIIIPNSVPFIGATAFEETPWLNNQTDEFVIVGDGVLIAYNGNDNHVTVPNNIKMISSGFYGLTFIESINLPDSVTCIGESAFAYCESLSSITIPDSVTYIGESAFAYCESLSNITIPDSVTYIGESAFAYCLSLSSITIPDSVTYIGNSVFSGCVDLSSVAIPDSVTCIGEYAFENCFDLSSVTIPDSVAYIGEWAFYECDNVQLCVMQDSYAHLWAIASDINYIVKEYSDNMKGDYAVPEIPEAPPVFEPDYTEGNQNTVWGGTPNLGGIVKQDNYLYYCFSDFSGNANPDILCKMPVDAASSDEVTLLVNSQQLEPQGEPSSFTGISQVQVLGDWVYFRWCYKENNELFSAFYRVRTDGYGLECLITRPELYTYLVYKDRFYYIDSDYENVTASSYKYHFYVNSMSVDGTDERTDIELVITDSNYRYMDIYGFDPTSGYILLSCSEAWAALDLENPDDSFYEVANADSDRSAFSDPAISPLGEVYSRITLGFSNLRRNDSFEILDDFWSYDELDSSGAKTQVADETGVYFSNNPGSIRYINSTTNEEHTVCPDAAQELYYPGDGYLYYLFPVDGHWYRIATENGSYGENWECIDWMMYF